MNLGTYINFRHKPFVKIGYNTRILRTVWFPRKILNNSPSANQCKSTKGPSQVAGYRETIEYFKKGNCS